MCFDCRAAVRWAAFYPVRQRAGKSAGAGFSGRSWLAIRRGAEKAASIRGRRGGKEGLCRGRARGSAER